MVTQQCNCTDDRAFSCAARRERTVRPRLVKYWPLSNSKWRCSAWKRGQPPKNDLAVMPTSTQPSKLLLIGVMTSPLAFNRRYPLRVEMGRMNPSSLGVTVRFVVGVGCRMDDESRLLLQEEMLLHADMVQVDAADCSQRHKATPKTMAFFAHIAVNARGYRWVAKTDDDTFIDLPKLQVDVLRMEATGKGCGHKSLYAYYGVLRWRLWDYGKGHGCGPREDHALCFPGQRYCRDSTHRAFDRLLVERGCACSQGVGPYPFGDGSLYVLSAPLLNAVFTGEAYRNLSRGGYYDKGDDVATGHLVFSQVRCIVQLCSYHPVPSCAFACVVVQSVLQQLPTMFFSLRRNRHNRFWVSLRDNGSLPDRHTVYVHRMYQAEQLSLAAHHFRRWPTNQDHFSCTPCREGWGWREAGASTPFGHAPMQSFSCCTKELV